MSAVPRPSDSDVGRRRVLVVDDNEDNAESVATLLALHGCSVRTWFSADGVVEQIRQFRPDVVFMDLDFGRGPEMDLVRHICGEKNRPVVAILSGWTREVDRTSVTKAGCDLFLTKGDDPQALIDVALNGVSNRWLS